MFHGTVIQYTQKETIVEADQELEVIRVPDVTPAALDCVLTYLYSEKVELEIDCVFDVLYAGQ